MSCYPDHAVRGVRAEPAASTPDQPQTPAAAEPGPLGLSPREIQVLAFATGGLTNRQIAERMQSEPKTIKNRIRRIYRKLGAASRAEAITLWKENHGMRPIDYNGHVPDSGDPRETLLSTMARTQELIYELAGVLGVSRAELDERAGRAA